MELPTAKQAKDHYLWIFDFDGTMGKLDIDWTPHRGNIRGELEGKYKLVIPKGMTRVDEMEAYLLEERGQQAFQDILYIRNAAESTALEKDVLENKKISHLIREIHESKGRISGKPPYLTVLSNNRDYTVKTVLDRFNIVNYLHTIMGLESAGKPKPHTDGLVKLLKKYDARPSESIFIGDSDATDGAVSRKLGIPFVKVEMPK